MALIEFKCPDCGAVFEELVAISEDRNNIKCPQCGKAAYQNFTGKCYGKVGSGGGCSGNCKTCGGCK